MEIFLIIIIGIGALWALITGIVAIAEAWQYSLIIGDSSKFMPHVWGQMQGNLIAVLGVIVFSIPVWIILSIVISIKLKNPNYRTFTKIATDERYSNAIELVEKEKENVEEWEDAKIVGVNYLIQKGIPEKEAEENINLLVGIKILSQIEEGNYIEKEETNETETLETNNKEVFNSNKALEQIVINGEHEEFVKKFPNGWTHQDWLDFKEDIILKYGNVDEHKLGNLIEIAKN